MMYGSPRLRFASPGSTIGFVHPSAFNWDDTHNDTRSVSTNTNFFILFDSVVLKYIGLID